PRKLMLLGVIRDGDAIFAEAARRNPDLLREGAELRKRHRFVENLPVFRVIDLDVDRLANRECRLIFVQVPRDSLEVNEVAGLINPALGEKKNRTWLDFIAVIVGHAEAIERDRSVAAIDRDQIAVAFALSEHPARLVAVGK